MSPPLALRTFQREFIKRAFQPEIHTAALSVPRGNGKSWLAALIAARAMQGLRSYQEVAMLAASIEQARIMFRFTRQMLGEADYRYLDSSTRCAITRADGARLRVIGSNGRTAMGLVNTPLAVADEPGSWEQQGGELMHDALQTAQGKPGSPLKVCYIGTLAPARGGWWHDLIDRGTVGSTYVKALRGDRRRWDKWPEIRRCNPLCNVAPEFRHKLLEERDEARRDSRRKARFLSYRLNVPTADESEVLLTVEDYEAMAARPLPGRQGRPIVAVDMGGGRSWSAAVAAWRGGRVETLAVAPGLPGLDEQERRDRVPVGTYTRLAARGVLSVAKGLRVQPPADLWRLIMERWGVPAIIVCDRFRLPELLDTVQGRTQVVPRVVRWSEAGEDIRALRGLASDGPFAVAPGSREILAASLAVALVKNDDQGNCRLVKRTRDNSARDDVAAALVLAAGHYQREERQAERPASAYAVV